MGCLSGNYNFIQNLILQPWNAFDDSIANVHHNSLGNQPQINVPHVPFPRSFVSGDHAGIGTSKVLPCLVLRQDFIWSEQPILCLIPL